MGVNIFLNLTNGLEMLPAFPNASFVRIQSTACEQKRWQAIIDDLDHTFLMRLAIGEPCVVVDFSQKKGTTRALYQGVPFIAYVLNKVWGKKQPSKVIVNGANVIGYFDEVFSTLDTRKLDYFKKFIKDESPVVILPSGGGTCHDGDYAFYKELITHDQ